MDLAFKDGSILGTFGMKPSNCSLLLRPPAQLNNLWLKTQRSTVFVAVVGQKPPKCLDLTNCNAFLRPKGQETGSLTGNNNLVKFEITSRGLPPTTASTLSVFAYMTTLSETVCPGCPGWDWRFSVGTVLGSWPKPTVIADKERGGHWMWKPVWLISNKEEGGGTLLCLAVTLHPAQSVGEGSSGLQPGRTMKALQA